MSLDAVCGENHLIKTKTKKQTSWNDIMSDTNGSDSDDVYMGDIERLIKLFCLYMEKIKKAPLCRVNLNYKLCYFVDLF